MFSSVFAIDLSQAFSQANQQSESIGSFFTGKATVSNLYFKALKLAKDSEVVSTTVSFSQLKAYFSTCTALVTGDFINILYHSNSSFKNTFDLILPSWTKQPTVVEINKSYAKFFACKQIYKPTSADVEDLNNEINTTYYAIYTNTYTMSTLNKANFGSDLFWNGTLDDSDFDLLYDINQIGKIFFEGFVDSPQILFYRLPLSEQFSFSNTSLSSSPTSANQNSYQLGTWSTSVPSDSTGVWLDENISSWWSLASIVNPLIPSVSSSTNSSLAEVQAFIDRTNNVESASAPAGVALVVWNQCLSGDAPVVEEQIDLVSPEEYISGIVHFIDNANINDVVASNLLADFAKKNILASGASTSDTWYADSVARKYAEQAFGDDVPWTCQYTCKDLPLDKQAKCELDCAGSCIQKCTDTKKDSQVACSVSYDNKKNQCGQLSLIKKAACLVYASAQKKLCDQQVLANQVLCVSDCTCFLIAWPNGLGREKMEDMYRIKFCKYPVQKTPVRPWKKVFSIQAIFQEISDVLEWLRDSGQMIKFTKTREFLDGNIKIKFADNFAFNFQVDFKPVFPKISTTTKIQEQSQANTDLNLGVLDMNASAPEADNYNKYIIVADPISNNASLEPSTSLSDINKNIQDLSIAASATENTKLSTETLDALIPTYTQHINVLFVQNMIEFLKDNQTFLQNLSEGLLDINKMTLELKTKIEDSN